MKPTCSIDGCAKPKYVRGWCSAHYSKWRRYGDPTAGRTYSTAPDDGKCTFDGCDRPYHAQGWCGLHYRRWEAHGDPSKAMQGRPPTLATSCRVDHCANPGPFVRGLCDTHYYRWNRYGDPETRVRFADPEKSFAARTEWQGDCLIWTGAKSTSGYGRLRVDGAYQAAHRYAWERIHGPIPEGMVIDHAFHCDPACVNVEHLRLATYAQNSANRSGAKPDTATGVRNVSVDSRSGKYVVQVVRHGRAHSFGTYTCLEEASNVAELARRELFGAYAGKG